MEEELERMMKSLDKDRARKKKEQADLPSQIPRESTGMQSKVSRKKPRKNPDAKKTISRKK